MKASRLILTSAVATLLSAGAFAQSPTPDQSQPTNETQPQDPNSQSAPQSTPTPRQGTQQGATFESLDTNSDGKISKTEAAADENVSAQFSKYDMNGDGFITRDEVHQANSANSPSGSQPQ